MSKPTKWSTIVELPEDVHDELVLEAYEKGITIEELLRLLVLAEIAKNKSKEH